MYECLTKFNTWYIAEYFNVGNSGAAVILAPLC